MILQYELGAYNLRSFHLRIWGALSLVGLWREIAASMKSLGLCKAYVQDLGDCTISLNYGVVIQ